MRKLILLFSLFVCFKLSAPPPEILTVFREQPTNPYTRIFEAVCMVESSGDSMAYNPKEGATGILQIREIRLRDYCIRTGEILSLADCYDKEVSKRIFLYYCCLLHEEERIIRGWNGRWELTDGYYRRVKKNLERL